MWQIDSNKKKEKRIEPKSWKVLYKLANKFMFMNLIIIMSKTIIINDYIILINQLNFNHISKLLILHITSKTIYIKSR